MSHTQLSCERYGYPMCPPRSHTSPRSQRPINFLGGTVLSFKCSQLLLSHGEDGGFGIEWYIEPRTSLCRWASGPPSLFSQLYPLKSDKSMGSTPKQQNCSLQVSHINRWIRLSADPAVASVRKAKHAPELENVER